jgi:hypothetical protein
MSDAAYDIFKRDGFGTRVWVEAAGDLEAAKLRIIALSADSPGKYAVVSRANGQMVGGGTTITNNERTAERPTEERRPQAVKGSRSLRKPSPRADAESETLWR